MWVPLRRPTPPCLAPLQVPHRTTVNSPLLPPALGPLGASHTETGPKTLRQRQFRRRSFPLGGEPTRGQGGSVPDHRTTLLFRALSSHEHRLTAVPKGETRGGSYFHKVDLIALHVNNRHPQARETQGLCHTTQSLHGPKTRAPGKKKRFSKGSWMFSASLQPHLSPGPGEVSPGADEVSRGPGELSPGPGELGPGPGEVSPWPR